MIPKDYITEWREHAPWVADRQVEQDLVISRALVELFSREKIANSLAFRGGTALYKLHLRPAARYSEDISWLGQPRWKQSPGRATLKYRFNSEDAPPAALKLKIEINTDEHFAVYGLQRRSFGVKSRWFTGRVDIPTYELDELLGTKLRALYQRKKGRDLFDLWLALGQETVRPERIIDCFGRYIEAQGVRITRAMFEQNLAEKRNDPDFTADMAALLAPNRDWSFEAGFTLVSERLISRLSGEAWKGG